MSGRSRIKEESPIKRIEELKVVFEFEIDESKDSLQRTKEVRKIIAEMLFLAHKRGRPAVRKENYEEAA